MIVATLILNGFFVNKPRIFNIEMDEDDIAMEKKNETTGKHEKLKIGQLYSIFSRKQDYIRDASDPEDHITPEYFEMWFYEKFIKNSGLQIISITYDQRD
tara:strand:- start:52 stop:351 length:300 start_codon:yes stop_codon:yes gene_type:complete